MAQNTQVLQVDLIEKEIIEVELVTIDLIAGRTISGLQDTQIDTPTDGEVLVLEDGVWVNKSINLVIDDYAIHNEVPTFISGTRFQTANAYRSDTLQVFLNGLKEKNITQISDTLFELPIYNGALDTVEVSYIKK